MSDLAEDEKPRRETLSDVAALAGVSPKTVSRALRQPEDRLPRSAPPDRGRDQEIGYIPNQIARALASARTGTIGILVPSLTNGVFAALPPRPPRRPPAGGPAVAAHQLALRGKRKKRREIATLLGYHPEAIILAGIDQTDASRRQLERARVPVVQTMELTDNPIDVNIGFRQVEAAGDATRLLLGMGHRRVGHIAARLDIRTRRRMDSYANVMRDAGLEPLIVTTPEVSTIELGGPTVRRTARSDAGYRGALLLQRRRRSRCPVRMPASRHPRARRHRDRRMERSRFLRQHGANAHFSRDSALRDGAPRGRSGS